VRGRRNLAFYDGQEKGTKESYPEGRYHYTCCACGVSSSQYVDDLAEHVSEILAVMRGERSLSDHFRAIVGYSDSVRAEKPKCTKCGETMAEEDEYKGLCADCAETEILNELWSEGNTSGSEIEELERGSRQEGFVGRRELLVEK
jgi:ribosomal protein S27AE